MTWHKARDRQHSRLYKSVKPIGDPVNNRLAKGESVPSASFPLADFEDAGCNGCGHHVCSCKKAESYDGAKLFDTSEAGSYSNIVKPQPVTIASLTAVADKMSRIKAEEESRKRDYAEWSAKNPPIESTQLMLDGEPLRVGDELEDREVPKPLQPHERRRGLAPRLFRVTGLNNDSVDMVLLNKSDGSLWWPPAPCNWPFEDVRDELTRRVAGIGGSRYPENG